MHIVNIKKNHNKKYIENVARLEQELWCVNEIRDYEITIKNALKRNNYTIFLALEDDIPLGYIETDIFYSWDEIYSKVPILKICGLYVTPTLRRKGVASSLIKEAEKYAKELGCKQIASDYYSFNTTSEKLHESLGFVETSKIVNVIKNI